MSTKAQMSGKKFRARLAITTSYLLGLPKETSSSLGVFVELLQAASLVHDDVVDEATTRRGQQTVNNLKGNRFAVLTGDFIISQALAEIGNFHSPQLVALFSKTTAQMSLGEAMEIECAFANDRTVEHYLATISLKTASLMSYCSHAPAVAAGSDSKTATALSDFGLNVGMAFQLVDDIKDFTVTDGKKQGKDFEEGIMTHPMILLERDSTFWRKDFQSVKDQSMSSGALAKTAKLAGHYCQRAKKNLESLPANGNNDGLELLVSIADSVMLGLPDEWRELKQ